ncbi:hypothetical protein [Fluviicola sp.]|uniref:hypothetical protein n=1 Tax=Fluviicola sp. TaxID=1917219 RepID=UPI0031DAD71E
MMLVSEIDFDVIHTYLEEQRWVNGYEFVAYPDSGFPIEKYEMALFNSEEEAREYCSEVSTASEEFKFLSVRSAYRAMQYVSQKLIAKIERNGAIDVTAMIKIYHQQLEYKQLTNNKKGEVMNDQEKNGTVLNEQNFTLICDRMTYCGIDEIPTDKLREAMLTKAEKIDLKTEVSLGEMGRSTGKAEVTLHLSKSQSSDNYYLNSYTLNVASEDKNILPIKQKFYVDNGIKVREAYNLIEGRSVFKTQINQSGQPYKAWLHINFKDTDDNGNFQLERFGEKYGYDLEAKLSKLPIPKLAEPEYKAEVIKSLEAGNRVQVEYNIDGKDAVRYIEAVPQYKSLNVYGEDHKLIRTQNKKSNSQSQNSNSQTTDQKTALKDDESKAKSQENGVKGSQSKVDQKTQGNVTAKGSGRNRSVSV